MENIEHVRAEYEKLIKPVPNNKKNDADWLRNQIDEYMEKGLEIVKQEVVEINDKSIVPADIQELGESIAKLGNFGKFYSENWEMSVDKDGVSFKQL